MCSEKNNFNNNNNYNIVEKYNKYYKSNNVEKNIIKKYDNYNNIINVIVKNIIVKYNILNYRVKFFTSSCLIILFCFIGFCFASCYSFTGGSVPSHLKTLQIQSVTDQSGFGNPEYKINLETALVNNFTRDNSFELTGTRAVGDARLIVSIISINETTQTISSGELETEKRVTVTCSTEYYDNVNKKQIWKRNFSNFGIFEVSQALTGRNEAIQVALVQLAEDIMLAVVSGW